MVNTGNAYQILIDIIGKYNSGEVNSGLNATKAILDQVAKSENFYAQAAEKAATAEERAAKATGESSKQLKNQLFQIQKTTEERNKAGKAIALNTNTTMKMQVAENQFAQVTIRTNRVLLDKMTTWKALDTVLMQANQKLAQVRWAMVNVGFVIGGLAGLATPFVLLLKAGMDWELQLKKIQAVSEQAFKTPAGMAQLSSYLMNARTGTPFSSNEMADAMLEFSKAGFSVQDSMKDLPAISNLAIAGFTDLSTATRIVAATLNEFKTQGVTAAEVADVIAKAANKSALSVETFGTAMSYVGPIAAQLGYSFKETSAALVVLSNSGLTGSKSGTTFRQVVSSIANPTREASIWMKNLGISFFNANGSAKNLSDSLNTIREGLNKLNPEQRAKAIGDMFEIRSAAGVSAFMNFLKTSSGEGLDEIINSLDDTGYAAELAAKQMEASVNKLKESINALKDTFKPLATSFNNMFSSMLSAIAPVIESFNKLNQETQGRALKYTMVGATAGAAAGGYALLKAVERYAQRGSTPANPLYVVDTTDVMTKGAGLLGGLSGKTAVTAAGEAVLIGETTGTITVASVAIVAIEAAVLSAIVVGIATAVGKGVATQEGGGQPNLGKTPEAKQAVLNYGINPQMNLGGGITPGGIPYNINATQGYGGTIPFGERSFKIGNEIVAVQIVGDNIIPVTDKDLKQQMYNTQMSQQEQSSSYKNMNTVMTSLKDSLEGWGYDVKTGEKLLPETAKLKETFRGGDYSFMEKLNQDLSGIGKADWFTEYESVVNSLIDSFSDAENKILTLSDSNAELELTMQTQRATLSNLKENWDNLKTELSGVNDEISRLTNQKFTMETPFSRVIAEQEQIINLEKLRELGVTDAEAFIQAAINKTAGAYAGVVTSMNEVTAAALSGEDAFSNWQTTVREHIRALVLEGNNLSVNTSEAVRGHMQLLASTSMFKEKTGAGGGKSEAELQLERLQLAQEVYFNYMHGQVNFAIQDEEDRANGVADSSDDIISSLRREYDARSTLERKIEDAKDAYDGLDSAIEENQKKHAANALTIAQETSKMQKIQDTLNKFTFDTINAAIDGHTLKFRQAVAAAQEYANSLKVTGIADTTTSPTYVTPTQTENVANAVYDYINTPTGGDLEAAYQNAVTATEGLTTAQMLALWNSGQLYMAEGGIVTKPTVAMIGESGPEAVIPLNEIGSYGNSGNSITIGNITINGASGDASDFAYLFAKELKKQLRTL